MASVLASALNAAVGVAMILGIIALAIYGWFQRLCPHCGSTANQWKSNYPVCQKCGRNRVTGGAGEARE